MGTKNLFQKGHKKTGGRTKGSLNKKTYEARALAEKYGYDPIECLIVMATSDTSSPDRKFECHAKLADYMYPKVGAINLTLQGPGGGPIKTEVQSSELKELLSDFESMLQTKFNERKD